MRATCSALKEFCTRCSPIESVRQHLLLVVAIWSTIDVGVQVRKFGRIIQLFLYAVRFTLGKEKRWGGNMCKKKTVRPHVCPHLSLILSNPVVCHSSREATDFCTTINQKSETCTSVMQK
ncbi:hypothetical protein AVEN_56719-1 [Araneus ventricosus]|uniref:Uncharacterized protein n=1 Tax=Araneus ventricosus TaxID=182803 RepID=A0A4Y2EBX0_ARAVE|nr:hypothetical protein AVEN_56719-1 [Araneus ventricosus]